MHYNDSEVIAVQKNATINVRVDPEVKQSAESVLGQLGLSMSTAVEMFLRQVSLTGSIPFAVALPRAPKSLSVSTMSDVQLREGLLRGYREIGANEGRDASEAFSTMRGELFDE